jgi:hypothetical protein
MPQVLVRERRIVAPDSRAEAVSKQRAAGVTATCDRLHSLLDLAAEDILLPGGGSVERVVRLLGRQEGVGYSVKESRYRKSEKTTITRTCFPVEQYIERPVCGNGPSTNRVPSSLITSRHPNPNICAPHPEIRAFRATTGCDRC